MHEAIKAGNVISYRWEFNKYDKIVVAKVLSVSSVEVLMGIVHPIDDDTNLFPYIDLASLELYMSEIEFIFKDETPSLYDRVQLIAPQYLI
jgi:hypothetical protein